MIFKGIFKYKALNWAVPFFTFVVFSALGIDYSVFLLIRFYEYRNLELSEALKLTSANIGHVVTSAVNFSRHICSNATIWDFNAYAGFNLRCDRPCSACIFPAAVFVQ